MHKSFLYLIITLTITAAIGNSDTKKVDVRLPVHRPEEVPDKNPDNVNVLLATLFEMHHDLLAQISLLEDKLKTSLPVMEKSEIKHMVEHYTAQKNNIELSIQQIQANDGLDVVKERSAEKDSAIETKSIPLLVNFFKRNQSPTTESSNQNIAYSLAYQPAYFEPKPQPQPQPAPTFVYQAPSPPIQVPVYQPQVNPTPQIYFSGEQTPVYYTEASNNQQYVPPAQPQYQVQYQPQYQPQSQPQVQVQSQPDQQQFVSSPQVTLYSQSQETIPEPQYQHQSVPQEQPQSVQQAQPQDNLQYQTQAIQQQSQQQYQSQEQVHLQQQNQQQPQQQTQTQSQPQQQQQFDFETVFKPSSVPVRRPQSSEYDTQRYQQQGPFGQKEGIFVYYPNGIITDDKERPSIANRFGQAFDRFGQVISNLGNWQSSGNPTIENVTVSSSPRLEPLSPTKVYGQSSKTEGEVKKVN